MITLIATVLLVRDRCACPPRPPPWPTGAEPDDRQRPAATTHPSAGASSACPIGWTCVGANQRNDVAVPVPQGVVPTVLTGQIGSVVNAVTGRVDVLDSRGVFLGSHPDTGRLATDAVHRRHLDGEVTDGIVPARVSFCDETTSPPTAVRRRRR